jgi:hypothetical protein
LCVENNLEWLAEGFGSFVQDCLRPLSGVTWLGCDAAVPGGQLDVGLMRCQVRTDLMMAGVETPQCISSTVGRLPHSRNSETFSATRSVEFGRC